MLLDQFAALDQLLVDHRHLWQIDPFHLTDYPVTWETGLVQWLEQQSLDQLAGFTPGLFDAAPAPLPSSDRWQSLTRVPERRLSSRIDDRFFSQHIPGRKWQQIQYFAGATPLPEGAVLEWCAGKGHLGRLLAHTSGQPVTSLEWQDALCQAGNALARQKQLDQRFVCTDVLSTGIEAHFTHHHTAVALHACGDLHLNLIRHWPASGVLACAPCCYHLSATPEPLSDAGKRSALGLRARDLHLPLQEFVTGGAGSRRLRDRQLLWRMAFDAWQRAHRGVDEYLPLPTLKTSQLNDSVLAFFQWAAEEKGLALAPDFDPAPWLAKGQARADRVRRMEWVSHWFRRPLELWLVLDRALLLEQKGAAVEVVAFCPYHLTPRNLLIIAKGL
ncbi:methyltransferase [Simiduia agarivorans]|nr:methyltransferase [Simiduia agarivorans]